MRVFSKIDNFVEENDDKLNYFLFFKLVKVIYLFNNMVN